MRYLYNINVSIWAKELVIVSNTYNYSVIYVDYID